MSLKLTNTFIIIFLLTSCNVQVRTENATTPTPFIITATLPASLTPPPSETPLPPPPPPTAVSVQGTASTQLNIRSGPGTSFNSLGILNANDAINLTGKNTDGSWLQIEFAAGPDGKGWVNAGFVKADNVDGLPIVADSGEVVDTGTPVGTPPPPAPTIVPATMDFDSADAPLKTVVLEDAGTHTVLYNGDVSAPDGDTEDWIAIIPFEDVVFIGMQCDENASVTAEVVGTPFTLLCNETIKPVTVQRGTSFLVHIRATAGQLQYTNYTLTIKASP